MQPTLCRRSNRYISQFRKASVLSNNPSFSYIPFDLSALNSSDVSSSLTPLLCESLGSNEFTLVFNAAEFYSGSQRLKIDQIGSMFNVNLFSIMQLVDQLKHLNLRRILFINSVSGLVGQDNQHEYSASKHALMGYSRSLMKEAKNAQFDVMTINPGGIATELWSKNDYGVDTSRFMDPSSIASLCIHLLSLPPRVFVESNHLTCRRFVIIRIL